MFASVSIQSLDPEKPVVFETANDGMVRINLEGRYATVRVYDLVRIAEGFSAMEKNSVGMGKA